MIVDEVFRTEWPRLVATLVRDFGDLELAEDCAQEAFIEASTRWDRDGTPERPGAWLTTTARRKALDRLRRASSYEDKLAELEARSRLGPEGGGTDLVDEQLALLLGCCHPSLNLDAQVALTLRIVAGLTTRQIARAFLVDEATMGKRLTRAKNKIRAAGVPIRTVDREDLAERLDAVRHVVYLIFTEGHTSRTDEAFVRGDLCDEAAWLAGLLVDLLPAEGESSGLHALILLTDARRATRLDGDGVPVMLEHQDRTRWSRDKIERGLAALARAIETGPLGRFGLQALVASLHTAAPSFDQIDWPRVVRVYDAMLALDPSAVVELNRAVAVSFADGPEAGLAAIEPLRGQLDDYLYLHSARAELLRRLGRAQDAATAYERALACPAGPGEIRFLKRRLADL